MYEKLFFNTIDCCSMNRNYASLLYFVLLIECIKNGNNLVMLFIIHIKLANYFDS